MTYEIKAGEGGKPATVPDPARSCETCADGHANGMRCQGVLVADQTAKRGETIVFPCPQYVKEPDHE